MDLYFLSAKISRLTNNHIKYYINLYFFYFRYDSVLSAQIKRLTVTYDETNTRRIMKTDSLDLKLIK